MDGGSNERIAGRLEKCTRFVTYRCSVFALRCGEFFLDRLTVKNMCYVPEVNGALFDK